MTQTWRTRDNPVLRFLNALSETIGRVQKSELDTLASVRNGATSSLPATRAPVELADPHLPPGQLAIDPKMDERDSQYGRDICRAAERSHTIGSKIDSESKRSAHSSAQRTTSKVS